MAGMNRTDMQDRAALASVLLESLETDEGVEEAWAAEIQRRTAELKSGVVETVPPSGVYEYRLQVGSRSVSRSKAVLK